tara:strand:+ start:3430 stop:5322 length:1893 start_codon:yes stop_codon:yes gene_type:complete
MKKNYILTLFITLCFSVLTFGQGSESFANSNATSSYADGNFTGNDAITWTYIQSRDDNGTAGITAPALMLRRSSDESKVTSSTIAGGIGDFSVKLYKGFTGAGDRQVELFINGVSRGTSDTFDDYAEHIFTVPGINVTGDVIIEIKNTTSKQVIIDDITWTAPSSDPSLSITLPTDSQVFSASVTEIPIAFSISNFTLSGEVGETEVSDGTGDGYIFGTLWVNGVIDGTANIFTVTEAIDNPVPGETYVITAELVDNNGDSLSPKVETTVTFSVEFPCDLVLGDIVTTCVAETTSTDSYNISIPFTGGNTSTYILTADFGTIGGDDPSTNASGTITISNVTEGTDVVFTLNGDVTNSTCDLTEYISSPTCVPAPTCPAVGSIIVTEIMQNPNAVGDGDGEYFEVYNTTGTSIDMQGWLIKSVTTSSKDHVIANSLVVPANGYAVLGINSDFATNGGVTIDYQYGSNFFLGNGSDSIGLDCGSAIIDAVSWDNGATFPDPTGKSMELATNKYSETDNDNGANWAEAVAEISTGADLGTPGIVNSFVLSIANNSIKGFATYPNPVTNNKFTLTSNSASKKAFTIFNVLGKKVLSSSFNGVKSNVDVSTISSGIYILKVTEDGKTATKKLVIR